jgi:hypothetical protein
MAIDPPSTLNNAVQSFNLDALQFSLQVTPHFTSQLTAHNGNAHRN